MFYLIPDPYWQRLNNEVKYCITSPVKNKNAKFSIAKVATLFTERCQPR